MVSGTCSLAEIFGGFRMRLLRWLLISASSAAVAAALVFTAGSAVPTAAGPARTVHAVWHPSARFLSQARAALVRYLSHSHPRVMLARPGVRVSNTTTKAQSFNWSGYADGSLKGKTKAGTFTKVSGSWTVPAVTCTPEDRITSNWVGLDGLSDSTVEQDGTVSWCFENHAVYFSWYEMFPKSTVEVGKTVKAGDKISASVSRKGSAYTLKLTDSTHSANSFTKTASCKTSTCLDESAEWIVERPAFATGIVPLAQFTTTGFTAGSETANGKVGTIGSFSAVAELDMIDSTGSYQLATVSGLTGGKSFTDTWHNSY
jgi:hypothetical protein